MLFGYAEMRGTAVIAARFCGDAGVEADGLPPQVRLPSVPAHVLWELGLPLHRKMSRAA
jgi:hypothetical protein